MFTTFCVVFESIVLIFMFYVVFAAFRGQAFGNDQNVLISDIKGFIYMLLIPSVPVLIREYRVSTSISPFPGQSCISSE